MARSVAMNYPVRETINEIGPAALATVSGIPVRTLYRWAENDKVPGKGATHDWRLGQLKAAVDKAKRAKRKARS